MSDALWLVCLLLTSVAVWWLLRGLREPPPAPESVLTGDGPRVSVVVPARNEERALPDLLASVGASSYPVELVVVDDDSADATGDVARAAGATVVTPGAPPPGWTGKAWACHTGAERAVGEVLVFLDADTRVAPDAIARLVSVLTDRGGLVSVQPFHRTQRIHEQLSAYFNVVSAVASGVFAPGGAGRPMAFGPCLATRRVDYLAAGGHHAVRASVLDDVSMAVAYARVGLPTTCFGGGAVMWMRSYPAGVGQLASGWTKNIASGAGGADARSALVAAGWVAAHHAVAVAAIETAVELLGSRAFTAVAAGWCALYVACALHLRGVLRRLGDFHWWTWAVFPVPLLAFDVLFVASALATLGRRSVTWRGRRVPTLP